ncbi:imidazole glycerol phosphate synthase subunit HisF [Pedobacter deserti]|uniref:imidazole glycerol phosphate synthase subunit HisF n=1 Tax=Pedobacter deserti TaxID=2817382 RepID=UPI00210C8F96|nr:imidazole glycerol phosphate synthase cyclase subunit [Pedobacter sp. SYSU D00382]
MKTVRIIPRLDIKGPNLVKGIHLEGLRVLGKPADFAKYYYNHGADELMFQDVVASLYDRNGLHDIVSETARSIFIPITVGGGIRTLQDITKMLRAGADKISINTAAINNPDLIRQASEEFGSSTIVVAIEAIKSHDGKYYAFTDNGREYTGIEVIEWAQQVQDLGCGELIITSVDNEGTGKGFDTELISAVASAVTIPVIAHGGAGSKEDIEKLFDTGVVDAVALGSVLHYEAIQSFVLSENSETEGNFEFIKSGRSFSKFDPFNLKNLKEHLHSNDIYCR